MNSKKIHNFFISILTIIILILLWMLIAFIVHNSNILPSPLDAFNGLKEILSKNNFYQSIIYTFFRGILAFLISFLIALIFAFLSFYNKIAYNVINTITKIFRSIPTLSLVFILGAFYGGGKNGASTNGTVLIPIVVCCAVIMPAMYSAFFAAINNVSKDIIELDKILGVSKFKESKDIIFPISACEIIENSASSLTLGIKIIIASEVLAGMVKIGIGREMAQTQVKNLTSQLFAWTFVAIVICFVLEILVKLLKNLYKI